MYKWKESSKAIALHNIGGSSGISTKGKGEILDLKNRKKEILIIELLPDRICV